MLISFETQRWAVGDSLIAGIDEVGRGCLAGPVVTAVVILNKDHFLSSLETLRNNDISYETFWAYDRIKDSKLLSAKNRAVLSEIIKKNAIEYNICEISNSQIDTLGITRACQRGFEQNISALKSIPDHVFIDAFKIKSFPENKQTNIIKGDNKSITIAAASIIGKVYRDNKMIEFSKKFPEFEFDVHKGYGTKKHLEAIKSFGICEIHRKSFEPIKSLFK